MPARFGVSGLDKSHHGLQTKYLAFALYPFLCREMQRTMYPRYSSRQGKARLSGGTPLETAQAVWSAKSVSMLRLLQ